MAWLKEKQFPLYQSTSNHNTYDDCSEKFFCEVHPGIPQNGPDDQKGLAYFSRNLDKSIALIRRHHVVIDRVWRQRLVLIFGLESRLVSPPQSTRERTARRRCVR
jgi:hypothetical protein